MIRITLALAALLTVPAIAAERPLLDLVPPGAKVIAGMHVDRTLTSPLGRYLLSQAREDDPGLRKFIETTGFDPRRDLREIVMAAPDTARKQGVVLARGVFNGPQIFAAAQTHGGTVSTHNGVQVLQTPGDNPKWLAVMDGTVAVAGAQDIVKAVIEARNSGAAASAMTRKANSLNSLYDAWVVTAGMFNPPVTAGTPPAPAAALAAILESSAGIQFGANVRLTGEAVTRSEKDAQALVDVVKFMVSMLQLNRESNPQFALIEPILNTMEVRASASTVTMVLSVPESDLEQLLKPRRATPRRASR